MAHEPADGVPAWARRVAYAVPVVVLPSGIWRLGVLFADQKRGGILPDWVMDGYVIFLTLVSETLAFLAIGLIAHWGEVFPRWLPRLRGRRVPVAAAVVPGLAGAMILTAVFTVVGIAGEIMQTKLNGDPLPADYPSKAGGWHTAYFYVSYAPLVLWGPMLAVLTVAYWHRRTNRQPDPASS
ncbi:hypothetical protein ACQHIV_03810 [Kribbella sp. GL6]|uniref:hypothetical protein n=1 Tax=Kribbella sp. GL6 TaxID=3419765 RepID=UPI003CFF97D7